MFRYKLRTLLILLAILPPLLAVGWLKYSTWRTELAARERNTGLAKHRLAELFIDPTPHTAIAPSADSGPWYGGGEGPPGFGQPPALPAISD
jgi:hypothetical protein